MKPENLTFLISLIKDRSGIFLTEEKDYLLQTRLLPVARSYGLESLDDLCESLRHFPPQAMLSDVIDAMTTNESLFFRDTKPFNFLRETILPRLLIQNASSKKIRIWSAACSTGQEPYSLLITLKEEQAKLAGWKIEMLGTDLCHKALEQAREGRYSQFEVQRGMPIQLLLKYFEQKDEIWFIKPELKQSTTFQQHNLMDSSYEPMGTFDIIYCRNVLIYFDAPTKTRILENMAKILAPNGLLVLGATENILGMKERFTRLNDTPGTFYLANSSAWS